MIKLSQLIKRYFKYVLEEKNNKLYKTLNNLNKTNFKLLNKNNKGHYYIKGSKESIYDVLIEGFFTKYDIAYDINRSTRFADRLFEQRSRIHINKKHIVYLWHVKDNQNIHINKYGQECHNYVCGKFQKPQRVIAIPDYENFITNKLDVQHSNFYKQQIKSLKFYKKEDIATKLIRNIWIKKIDEILLNHYRKLLNIQAGSSTYVNDISYAKYYLYRQDHRFSFPHYKSISKHVNNIMALEAKDSKKHKSPILTNKMIKENEKFNKWW